MDEKKEKVVYKENSFYKFGFWILLLLLGTMLVLGYCSPFNKQYDNVKNRFQNSRPHDIYESGKENFQNSLKPNGNIEKETSNYYTKYPSNKYHLRYHETLHTLAMRFHCSVNEIREANPGIPATKPGDTIPPGETIDVPDKDTMDKYEQAVLNLTNKERAAAGLKALSGSNSQLNKSSMAKAQDMQQKGYFDHNSPTYGSPFEQMKQFGISYSYAAENIAKGYKTPEEVIKGWMNSPGHRANILNPNLTELGVGYVSNGGYWVQQFIGK